MGAERSAGGANGSALLTAGEGSTAAGPRRGEEAVARQREARTARAGHSLFSSRPGAGPDLWTRAQPDESRRLRALRSGAEGRG